MSQSIEEMSKTHSLYINKLPKKAVMGWLKSSFTQVKKAPFAWILFSIIYLILYVLSNLAESAVLSFTADTFISTVFSCLLLLFSGGLLVVARAAETAKPKIKNLFSLNRMTVGRLLLLSFLFSLIYYAFNFGNMITNSFLTGIDYSDTTHLLTMIKKMILAIGMISLMWSIFLLCSYIIYLMPTLIIYNQLPFWTALRFTFSAICKNWLSFLFSFFLLVFFLPLSFIPIYLLFTSSYWITLLLLALSFIPLVLVFNSSYWIIGLPLTGIFLVLAMFEILPFYVWKDIFTEDNTQAETNA